LTDQRLIIQLLVLILCQFVRLINVYIVIVVIIIVTKLSCLKMQTSPSQSDFTMRVA